MDKINENSPIAGVGIAAMIAIAQGEPSMCRYFAFVGVVTITVIAIIRQSLLDHNNHKREFKNGKVNSNG